jgi:hypothetical protein
MARPDWYQRSLDDADRIASRRVFFVVGCQKSGTTWVQNLLNGHPRVACGGEGHFADLLAPGFGAVIEAYFSSPKITTERKHRDLLSTTRLLIDRVLSTYVSRHADADRVEAVGDKTPESALALPVLDALYPDARFVHVIRDGRDGAVSGWRHLQRKDEAGRFPSFAAYAEYFAKEHWLGYIGAVRAAAAKWPHRVHEIRYEDLHATPHEETRRLLAFLEVDTGDDSVAACLEAGDFKRLSGGRERGEEDVQSHLRKGVVGDWREQFDAEAEARFEEGAGPLLEELGYATAASPVSISTAPSA